MSFRFRRARVGFGVTLVVAAVLILAVSQGPTFGAVARASYERLEAFTNVLAIVRKNYVDDVTTGELVEGAIQGMLTSLDPHSAYLTPELYRELQVDTKGTFGGLGIEVTVRDGILTVVSPIEGTPAFRAGLEPADLILKIDGEFTKELSLIEAVKRMRGPRGSKIVLTIRREGVRDLFDVPIVRDVIQIDSVRSRLLEPGYAYIRVTQFQERTDEELERALDEIDEESLTGVVLDLRSNPGGLLTQAVRVADLFLGSGMIVYTEGRLEGQAQRYFAHRRRTRGDFAMVVLINGGSASAAEIVAGALQDHRRALILGMQSFGKGSVQTILPLEDDSALRLTTARYYTPNGRSIQATGITPDIVMENRPVVVEEGSSGFEPIREENLRGHFENGEGEEAPGEGDPSDPDADDLSKDPQLQRALELLKSWEVFRSLLSPVETASATTS